MYMTVCVAAAVTGANINVHGQRTQGNDAVRPVPHVVAPSTGGVCSVLDYGAKGDGTTMDTVAINTAMEATKCSEVFFPPGRVYVSGTIVLQSHKAR